MSDKNRVVVTMSGADVVEVQASDPKNTEVFIHSLNPLENGLSDTAARDMISRNELYKDKDGMIRSFCAFKPKALDAKVFDLVKDSAIASLDELQRPYPIDLQRSLPPAPPAPPLPQDLVAAGR
jgi:hypothetical protein